MYFPDDHEQDEIYDEAIQTTASFYQPAAFANTDLPPVYGHSQSTAWQHQPGGGVNRETSQSWEPNRIINDHGPVMFDWYPRPVEPWDMCSRNLEATSQTAQIMAFQPPPFNSGYQEPPLRFEKPPELNEAWQRSYRAQEIYPAIEVVPQLWSRSGTLASNPPLSVELENTYRPSKRRRRSSTSTVEIQAAPATVGSVQPSPVKSPERKEALGQYRHLPTSFHVPDYASQAVEGSPRNASVQRDDSDDGPPPMTNPSDCIMPTMEAPPLLPTPISPVLTPSVRVISDRRESVSKLRRGSHTIFKTQSANTKRGHYASEVWESHKPAIKKMYIDEGKPLREVIKTMEKDHNFPAT